MRDAHEVVTGPNRKMSMAADQRSEVEKELAEVKREVIESRNLVIKTDNLLKNLHAEVKAVGKWQTDQQKKQLISSGVAYAAFAILAGVAAILVANAKVSGANEDRARLEKSVTDLTAQLDKQKADAAANVQAERAAGEVYKMMTELPGDQRLQGVDAYAKLDVSRLSALEKAALHDRADSLRKEVGDAALDRGRAAFHRNDMAGVVSELTRFQTMNPPQDELLDSSFFLGVAYNQLKKHDLAVPQLARFVENDKHSHSRDYGMLLLAQSYEATGQAQKAVDVARAALGAYPNSQFAPQLRGRLANALRMLRAEQPKPGTPAAAPVTPAAAAH